jgi:hypothetical protein
MQRIFANRRRLTLLVGAACVIALPVATRTNLPIRWHPARASTGRACLFVVTVLLALAALFGIGLYRVVRWIIRQCR